MEKRGSIDRSILPMANRGFEGHVGMVAANSRPHYPPRVLPPDGAPNVLVVLLDDVGFGQISSFGGPVSTPTVDAVARAGLRYTRFHTTAMCSPTRAALLTGRNHHAVGFGHIVEYATGFPGYSSVLPPSAATLPCILRENGYATAAIGKWHNTPEWEMGPTGPFDRWPTGLGFEHFYGFMGGECNQYEPPLFEGTRPVEAPYRPEDGYILDKDLADRAIGWLRQSTSMDPDRPFFLWYTPGTAHSPLQAPKEWIDRYRGQFDHGWDRQRELTLERQKALGIVPQDTKLTPRPPEIDAWSSLTEGQKKLSARYQEAFAGALSYCDHQVGRILGTLEELGRRDNTLVVLIIGDNGPSAEGGPVGTFNKFALMNGVPDVEARVLPRIDEIGSPTSNSNYPCGWAWAGSSPLQWFKQIASHLGSVRNGLVVSWPKGPVPEGELRTQFHHCVDIAPTILEAAGIPKPKLVNGVDQTPFDGSSMCYSFARADAEPVRKRQYFELIGNRAIYEDGWIAGARHGVLPWQYAGGKLGDFSGDQWELYNLEKDFSQADNLAGDEAQRLQALKELWLAEAGRNGVFPLDDRRVPRLAAGNRPNISETRTSFRFFPGTTRIPESLAPNVKGRSHRFTCHLSYATGAGGIMVTAGGRYAGYVFMIHEGCAKYIHNFCDIEQYEVVSEPLQSSVSVLTFEFLTDEPKPGSGGRARILADGHEIGAGRIPRTIPNKYGFSETFNVGKDSGSAVTPLYRVPYEYSGGLRHVDVEILSDLSADDRAREREMVAKLALENE